jgi:hypothetical protein
MRDDWFPALEDNIGTIMKHAIGAIFFSATTLFAASAGAESLSELSCSELWYARNAIYAEAGYCFKTDRAISVFGKRCFPPYGELSGSGRQRVDEIKSWEERKGCSRD